MIRQIKLALKFIYEFFYWLGRQNDYLYPNENTKHLWYPYSKPHLWKTRFGFKTSFELADIIVYWFNI